MVHDSGCISTKDSSITLLSSIFKDNNNTNNNNSSSIWNINGDNFDNINYTHICIDDMDIFNDIYEVIDRRFDNA